MTNLTFSLASTATAPVVVIVTAVVKLLKNETLLLWN